MDETERGDTVWEQLQSRLERKITAQETELGLLGGEIEEIKRISKGIYPFFPPDWSMSTEPGEEEEKQKEKSEIEEQLRAEKEKTAKLSSQLEEITKEVQALRDAQKSAPSQAQFAQMTAETAQLKQANTRLTQELESARGDIKSRKATEKLVKRNITSLERNFEQLSGMYNQAVEQKTALKNENAEYLKNLMEKDDLIAQMEKRMKEIEEDTAVAIRNQSIESAVYIAGRATFPGGKLKKSGRHYVRIFETQTQGSRLSLRTSSDISMLFRNRPRRKASLDGSS